ncbi:MAG: beta-glycosidase [Prevotella sp.]|nr:beta-glycosidase [Prevotella sp.]
MNIRYSFLPLVIAATAITATAQTFNTVTSQDGSFWQTSKTALQAKAAAKPSLTVTGTEPGQEFKAWGTCFNELDWDALNMLSRDVQEEIMHGIFAPDGDLRFTRGRLSMNANDYSRSWYSCSDVPGDFELRYFNIERDKRNIIPLMRAAMKYNPDMTFWMSPWSPPAWMKINQDYPVRSSKYNNLDPRTDYLLFGNAADIDPKEVEMAGQQKGKFPAKLATANYLIQDPRYLQAYADMFCRFIDLYKEQGITIDMVMYQNEAYSYTPYPGCAWTADGTIRFNRDYLAPTLSKRHPEVKLYLGTFNTNRTDYVDRIVGGLKDCVGGLGFQWEGRENLTAMRKKYPHLKLISTESECGNGSMDWKAGEHTFMLLSDYIGKGCEEYYIWNFILADNGESPWGWRQNALVQVDSKTRRHRYTPEYYAVKHFSNTVAPGSRMVAYKEAEANGRTPVIVFVTPQNKRIVIAGNFNDNEKTITVQLGKRYLNAILKPHSFNTFTEK